REREHRLLAEEGHHEFQDKRRPICASGATSKLSACAVTNHFALIVTTYDLD
ncbi:MAG: hypothetical protein JWR14_3843, partial [Caballeronia sp.]|nr:hypothetical protein [Caballeronia sp.]